MTLHRLVPLEAPIEWAAALHGIRHGPAYTWEFCYAMHLTTHLATYLYCFEKDGVRIVCPIAEREYGGHVDIVKPFGFSGFVGTGNCSEFPRYWREFARQQGYVCGYLGVNPLFDNGSYYVAGEAHQYNNVYTLDLTLSEDELFANLSRNRKRDLKNWDTLHESIVMDRTVLRDAFLSMYHEFLRRKGAPSLYMFSGETLSFLADLDNTHFIGAQREGAIEAVDLVMYTPDVADALFLAVAADGQHSVALYWYTAICMKSLGIPLLNFGGSIIEDDGIARFKRSFGTQKVPLRCLKQVYEPAVYERLCRQAGADPGDRAGYFPAYRRPQ